MADVIRPRALNTGDRIALVATSWGAIPALPERADRAIRALRTLGFEPGVALQRAADPGQISAVSIEPRAQFLTAAFIGINLTHRNPANADVAHALLDGVRAEVATWPDRPT